VAVYKLDIPVLMLPVCRLYIWPHKQTSDTNCIIKIIQTTFYMSSWTTRKPVPCRCRHMGTYKMRVTLATSKDIGISRADNKG